MCCSTGVCGPDVDPVLPKFAADLDWLKNQGHNVERYNLAQQPQAFIENKAIHHLLSTAGTDCLPVVSLLTERSSAKPFIHHVKNLQAGLPVRQRNNYCPLAMLADAVGPAAVANRTHTGPRKTP
jgi:arsenite methyltransferase